MSNNIRRHRVASVAVGAAIIVGLGSVGAVADGLIGSADIKDNSIAKRDIGSRAVGGSEIKLDSVKKKHLAPKLRATINQWGTGGSEAGPAGPAGPQGPAGSQGPAGMGEVVDSFTDELASPFVVDEPTAAAVPTPEADYALHLPSRGTYLVSTNTVSTDALGYEPGDGFVAVGLVSEGRDDETEQPTMALGGLELLSTPVGTSTFTVSVDEPTTFYAFGLPVTIDGPEAAPVWGRVAATRVSEKFVKNLAPITDLSMAEVPAAMRKPMRSLERQLLD